MSRWPGALNLQEIQQSFRDVWGPLDRLLTGNQDLKGRKFLNVGDAVSPREFLTLSQGDKRYVLESKKTEEAEDVQAIRIGLYAIRGSAEEHRYTLFSASDRNYVTWASDGSNWIYAYGMHSRTEAQVTALEGELGTNDTGYLVWVSDVRYTYRWTGTAFEYLP